MKKFQGKKHSNKYKKIIHSKLVLVILGIFLIFFIFNIIKFIDKASDTRKNREIAENKVFELQQQKEKLEADILKLNTEKGVEENIRDKFGLGKAGEEMIVIIEDQNKVNTEEEDKKNGFFSFLKNLFK
ncbi:MAG: septum formation initiator family protein [Patescibacteria group bacterium]